MDAMLANIKLKKKLEYLFNLAKENHELRELVKALATTVEDLKDKVDLLSVNNSADNILSTLENALTRIREYEIMEDESWN
ncbi:hypothetical protein MNO09_10885 [Bacillus sp. N5-665]|uniref:hypothetical protein n=1 Tax=Bacillus sp. N5-665 TaxID=2925318 RepID=UPI001F52B617|nr:hypothetical protein [Bacillus sp. N5-665]UNK35298.1 hypothetical protein MNO09_10885 [Bacillus sp. N5-665]